MSGDWRLVIRRLGGPEVIEREPAPALTPGPGEALVRHHAVGVNFIDIYHRTGLYPLTLPSGLGQEAAGVVEAVGPGVDAVRPGDRVAYALGPLGACATRRTIDAALLVPLPDAIGFETAAAALLKGMTAEFLVERCARVQPGQAVLVHAAAGGVGTILVQWLKAIGAHVIAHAGSEEKAERAKALGADEALHCDFPKLAGRVRALTGGSGVAAVFDGVGAASWDASIGSAARRGIIVSFGNASGAVPPVAPLALTRAGSLFLTRPTLGDYCATREELLGSAARLFAMIEAGRIRIEVAARYPLAQAAEAQAALAERRTIGATVLLPG